MLNQEEIQLHLSDLRQAIQVERRFQYTDVQGKRRRFSQFLIDTIKQLQPFLMQRVSNKEWEPLLKASQHYPFADLQVRMRLIDKLQALLDAPVQKPEPTPKPKEHTVGFHGQRPEQTEVQFVKGIGPNLSKVLLRAEVRTVKELLYYFPKRYLDYQDRTPIKQLTEGQDAMVIATVKSASIHQPKNKKISFLTVLVTDETATIPATWIYAKQNMQTLHGLKAKFVPGAEVILTGKTRWDTYKRKLVLDKPDVEF